MNYEKVYIQKIKDGSTIKETIADFDIYCSAMPFKLYAEAKEPSKREWQDEHGDDEYIPADGLKMKAYFMDVEFCCTGDKFSIIGKLNNSIKIVTELNASVAEMKLNGTCIKIARQ